jgi:hypothetical protein
MAMVTVPGAALVCGASIALGLGWIVPISGAANSFFDVLAIGSGILLVGLLDGR